MRKAIYALALTAVCGMTAPLAQATARSHITADAAVQVELGAVRANVGTLYSVGSIGGPLVSTIETASWNTCTSGYSLVGYDFDQNGFWLCAPSDLTGGPQVFYVGNVVNNAGYWWRVDGGSVTDEGYQGWNYCPSAGTLLGTEFNSNGFWVCYVAPAPAPSGGGTTTTAPSPSPSGGGTTTTAPSPSPSGGGTATVAPPTSTPPTSKHHLPGIHARIVLHWVWQGAHTWLRGLQFVRLPRNAAVVVTCSGKGCPRAAVRGDARHLPTLRRRLVDHVYRRGDHITIKLTAPGATPEVASIVIRDGRMPGASLLAA